MTAEEALENEFGDEEFAQVEAFIEYFAKTCVGELRRRADAGRRSCLTPAESPDLRQANRCPVT